jgi:hypothetical protein
LAEERIDLLAEVFNHPQFYGASSVDGNIESPTFGQIVGAAPPRIVQLAMRLHF